MALVMSGSTGERSDGAFSEGARVRSNMSAFFLVGSLMSLGALAAAGHLHREIAVAFVVLIPAVVVGYFASRYVNRLLDAKRLRTVSIVVSTIGALLLIGQQILFFKELP